MTKEYNKWSEKETEILKKEYPKNGSDIPELKRNENQIKGKAQYLGLKSPKMWRENEINLLKEEYSQKGTNINLERSDQAIHTKANELGLKYYNLWSEEEEERLKEFYNNREGEAKELARELEKNINQIRNKAKRMNLNKQDIRKKEKEYLKKNYNKKSNRILADELNRSISFVRNHLKELGLKKTPEEKARIHKENVPKGEDNTNWSGGPPQYKCLNCGKKFIDEQYKPHELKFCSKRCMGEYWQGENHPRWNPNKPDQQLRTNTKYQEWRKEVLKRDDYICDKCKQKEGNNLQVHHIKSFSKYENLRYNIDNGIILCESCHKQFHNEYDQENFNKNDLNKFLNENEEDLDKKL